jgi:hypothetical protein
LRERYYIPCLFFEQEECSQLGWNFIILAFMLGGVTLVCLLNQNIPLGLILPQIYPALYFSFVF